MGIELPRCSGSACTLATRTRTTLSYPPSHVLHVALPSAPASS